jgi:hypothetical protein
VRNGGFSIGMVNIVGSVGMDRCVAGEAALKATLK